VSVLARRRRWDPDPTAPARVLLASDGTRQFSARAISRAIALADGGPVAVLTIARIYGSSLGMPNPGLLPTKAEMKERLSWVRYAISRLEGHGIEADGQVASTRRAARLIAAVARRRRVEAVVMDGSASVGWRRFVEGDPAKDVARRLAKRDVTVEIIAASKATSSRR
jgi:nucleotide-binding universal stress UspA family protein